MDPRSSRKYPNITREKKTDKFDLLDFLRHIAAQNDRKDNTKDINQFSDPLSVTHEGRVENKCSSSGYSSDKSYSSSIRESSPSSVPDISLVFPKTLPIAGTVIAKKSKPPEYPHPDQVSPLKIQSESAIPISSTLESTFPQPRPAIMSSSSSDSYVSLLPKNSARASAMQFSVTQPKTPETSQRQTVQMLSSSEDSDSEEDILTRKHSLTVKQHAETRKQRPIPTPIISHQHDMYHCSDDSDDTLRNYKQYSVKHCKTPTTSQRQVKQILHKSESEDSDSQDIPCPKPKHAATVEQHSVTQKKKPTPTPIISHGREVYHSSDDYDDPLRFSAPVKQYSVMQLKTPVTRQRQAVQMLSSGEDFDSEDTPAVKQHSLTHRKKPTPTPITSHWHEVYHSSSDDSDETPRNSAPDKGKQYAVTSITSRRQAVQILNNSEDCDSEEVLCPKPKHSATVKQHSETHKKKSTPISNISHGYEAYHSSDDSDDTPRNSAPVKQYSVTQLKTPVTRQRQTVQMLSSSEGSDSEDRRTGKHSLTVNQHAETNKRKPTPTPIISHGHEVYHTYTSDDYDDPLRISASEKQYSATRSITHQRLAVQMLRSGDNSDVEQHSVTHRKNSTPIISQKREINLAINSDDFDDTRPSKNFAPAKQYSVQQRQVQILSSRQDSDNKSTPTPTSKSKNSGTVRQHSVTHTKKSTPIISQGCEVDDSSDDSDDPAFYNLKSRYTKYTLQRNTITEIPPPQFQATNNVHTREGEVSSSSGTSTARTMRGSVRLRKNRKLRDVDSDPDYQPTPSKSVRSRPKNDDTIISYNSFKPTYALNALTNDLVKPTHLGGATSYKTLAINLVPDNYNVPKKNKKPKSTVRKSDSDSD